MGYGEKYWYEFADWYKSLSLDEREALKARYPEPDKVEQGFPWTGFYDRLEKH